MQFDKGDSLFLMSKCHTIVIGTKCHIATIGEVSGVVGDMFNGVVIKDGVQSGGARCDAP